MRSARVIPDGGRYALPGRCLNVFELNTQPLPSPPAGNLQQQRASLEGAGWGDEGSDPEEGLHPAPGPDISASMMSRLISLPDIVCKGATGEVYIVELR